MLKTVHEYAMLVKKENYVCKKVVAAEFVEACLENGKVEGHIGYNKRSWQIREKIM